MQRCIITISPPLQHITVYLKRSRGPAADCFNVCAPVLCSRLWPCIVAVRPESWLVNISANLLGDQKHLFLRWPSFNAANPYFFYLCSSPNRTMGCFHIRALFFLLNEPLLHPVLFVPRGQSMIHTRRGECLHNNQRGDLNGSPWVADTET